MSKQLRGQIELATRTEQKPNLFVITRTQSISTNSLDGVRSTGGDVYIYNPVTDTATAWPK